MADRKPNWIAVIVALIACGMLLSVLVAYVTDRKYGKRHTTCSANLRGIAQAMYLYAQDGEVFPMSFSRRSVDDGAMTIFSPEHRTQPPKSDSIPSPTVDLWQLVRLGNVTPRQFVCPLSWDNPDPALDTSAYYDFCTAVNLSYSYQYQYDPNRGVVGIFSPPGVPIMADGNPYLQGGIKVAPMNDRNSTAAGNSVTHQGREGQNVMFQDGHVSFERAPDVGLSGKLNPAVKGSRGRDNIYTVHETGSFVDPGIAPTSTMCNLGDKSDACLVP